MTFLWPKCPKKEFLLRVSYMEIYNETVTDLLVDSWKRKPLEVRETINVSISFTKSVSLFHSLNCYLSTFSINLSSEGQNLQHFDRILIAVHSCVQLKQ